MIGFIQGKLLKKEEDRILLLTHQIGYEILLPAMVMETLQDKTTDDELSFFIYYHQTERQPKPVLIGFNEELEKEFFQHFISVGDIGPLKALKAMNLPISQIAEAIESKNTASLSKLKGIGKRTAQKMIATLHGKLDRFVLQESTREIPQPAQRCITDPVMSVLVEQLGHRPTAAKKLISDALARNGSISTPEELFDEVYRGEKPA